MPWTRNLKKGVSGDDVMEAKQRLLSLGFFAKHVTTVTRKTFGSDTVEAVKRFQQQAGLTVDGVIGSATWTALFAGSVSNAKGPDVIKPSAKALAIVDLARIRLGDVYVWGGSGMTDISDSAIHRKDDADGAARSIAFRDRQYRYGYADLMGHDCSGFISWLMRETSVWDSRRDCDELWKLCTEIQRNELLPGDWLFRVSSSNSADETHIGLYCGHGVVIHAKGRDVGVVLEGINQGGSGYWHKAGRCKLLYE